MHTRPILYTTTVPSFRRRLTRLFGALRRLAGEKPAPQIPDYLREDIGLTPRRRRPRAHAPPEGNPYWRI